MFGWPIAIALIGFGVLELAAAIALLRERAWGRVVLIESSVLLLPVFPIGTTLTVCTLWALMPSSAVPKATRNLGIAGAETKA